MCASEIFNFEKIIKFERCRKSCNLLCLLNYF